MSAALAIAAILKISTRNGSTTHCEFILRAYESYKERNNTQAERFNSRKFTKNPFKNV